MPPTATDLAELIETYESRAHRSGPLPSGTYPCRVTAVGSALGSEGDWILFVGVTTEGGYYDGTKVPMISFYSEDPLDERWDSVTDKLLAIVGGVGPVETTAELIEQLLGARVSLAVGEYDQRYADAVTVGLSRLEPPEDVVDK